MKKAIVIGAGPAGVTAAYEISRRSNEINVCILEASDKAGGISATYDFSGNKIDLGPHRFFSKNDRVMKFWQHMLPGGEHGNFLRVSRLTRIFFIKKFFDYPIKLNLSTLLNLGFARTAKIGFGYIKALAFPIKENSLEDFFINRFGKELYLTFFKDYTEKVWGIKCSQISSDWGAQRVKGISIKSVIFNAAEAFFAGIMHINRKKIETSLVESFFYPEFGAGQMYEKIAAQACESGAEMLFGRNVISIVPKDNKFVITAKTPAGTEEHEADYVFSSMPVKELINAFPAVPANVKSAANGLVYRDYILVALLLKKFHLKEKYKEVKDNWIYLQDRDMTAGRLMIMNNFSMKMLKDQNTYLLGAEYFCTEGDKIWSMADEELCSFAAQELAASGIINKEDIIQSCAYRQKKAYPAYFGTYSRFNEIKQFTDSFPNLWLIGRNGMHRYNNMDHSVLSAMTAADLMLSGNRSKKELWEINTEKEYHEEKTNK